MIGVVLACAAATIAFHVADPTLAIMDYDDLREGQLEAAAAMVMAVAGGVLLGRFRREGSSRLLLLAAGLLVLAVENVFAAVAAPVADSLAADHAATWTAATTEVLAAVLVLAAALVPDRSVVRRGRTAAVVLGGTAAAFVALALASNALRSSLPDAFATIPSAAREIVLLDEHPALLAFQLFTAVAWGVAAWRLAAVGRLLGDRLLRWIGVGGMFAAAAYGNYALFPSQFTELLYIGDAFLLVAIGCLLYGTVREITSDEETLVRLAVSTERERVASELRAGVAQELALMAAQADWISRQPAEEPRFRELAASVERALDESRTAISSLARPVDEPLATALAHAAQEAADRVGARLELRLDRDVRVSREWRDALVRFTRDSIAYAVRSGGGHDVAVDLRNGRHVALRILYERNGDAGVRASTIDVQALRERTEALGARFNHDAEASTGTLEIVLP